MMTSSNGNIFRVTGPLCGEFTGHRWIPLTKASGAELWCFLFICAWINSWVNNREAGDLRRHRTHYGVIVMQRKVREWGVLELAWQSTSVSVAQWSNLQYILFFIYYHELRIYKSMPNLSMLSISNLIYLCARPLIFSSTTTGHVWISHLFELGSCTVCCARFMCHHELWLTSVSHPFPSLNSSCRRKHYLKITIPVFRHDLQNFALPGCFPCILLHLYFFSLLLVGLLLQYVAIFQSGNY